MKRKRAGPMEKVGKKKKGGKIEWKGELRK